MLLFHTDCHTHFFLPQLHIQLSLTVFYTFNSSAIPLSTTTLCVYFTVVDGPTGNSSPRVGSLFNVKAEASFDIGVMWADVSCDNHMTVVMSYVILVYSIMWLFKVSCDSCVTFVMSHSVTEEQYQATRHAVVSNTQAIPLSQIGPVVRFSVLVCHSSLHFHFSLSQSLSPSHVSHLFLSSSPSLLLTFSPPHPLSSSLSLLLTLSPSHSLSSSLSLLLISNSLSLLLTLSLSLLTLSHFCVYVHFIHLLFIHAYFLRSATLGRS